MHTVIQVQQTILIQRHYCGSGDCFTYTGQLKQIVDEECITGAEVGKSMFSLEQTVSFKKQVGSVEQPGLMHFAEKVADSILACGGKRVVFALF